LTQPKSLANVATSRTRSLKRDGMYDFDRILNRSERTCLKRREAPGAAVPLGVADMDFQAPPAVQEALQEWVALGDMGYALPDPDLKPAIVDWLATRYGWSIEPEWILFLPGVVTGLAMFCHLLERPGDLVSLTPLYPPFFKVPEAGCRALRSVPMLDTDAGWRIDWEALDRACAGAAGLLLCQPHNPTGRVFGADELERMANLAERHDLPVCSDEIWSDLIIDPRRRHLPFGSLGSPVSTLTLMAPSKTFNIPGLGCSFAVCPDPALRRRLQALQTVWSLHPNAAGIAAALAAYRGAGDWLDACRAYLRDNLAHAVQALRALGLRVQMPEATYVVWARAGDAPDAGSRLAERCLREGLSIRPGGVFGDDRYVRINAATPRAVLDDALARLSRALQT
jgi:cystathionine beta-lyase